MLYDTRNRCWDLVLVRIRLNEPRTTVLKWDLSIVTMCERILTHPHNTLLLVSVVQSMVNHTKTESFYYLITLELFFFLSVYIRRYILCWRIVYLLFNMCLVVLVCISIFVFKNSLRNTNNLRVSYTIFVRLVYCLRGKQLIYKYLQTQSTNTHPYTNTHTW